MAPSGQPVGMLLVPAAAGATIFIVVVLAHGRIVEQGTHDDLLAAQGAYWRLYRDWMEQAAA